MGLSTSRWLGSAAKRKRRSAKRRLLAETLEQRTLLASDGTTLPTLVSDNFDAGFSTHGTWTRVPGGSGYAGSHDHSSTSGDTATWTFDDVSPGTYRVLKHWDADVAGGWQTVEIHVGGSVETNNIYQASASKGAAELGGEEFQQIGVPIDVAAGDVVVKLIGSGSSKAIADAVALVPYETPTVVDNADHRSGFVFTGYWLTTASDSYAGSSLLSTHSPTSVDSTAHWTFWKVESGHHQLSMHWLHGSDRAMAAQIRIYLDDLEIQTLSIDQRLAPETDLEVNGDGFQNIGIPIWVGASGGEIKVEIVSDPNDGKVSADAVAIHQAEPISRIVDDSNPDFLLSGTWTPESTSGYENGFRRSTAAGDTATWTFSDVIPGTYRLSSHWPEYLTGGSQTMEILHDGVLVESVSLNQGAAPYDNVQHNGVPFQQLGRPLQVVGGDIQVRLVGGSVPAMADAVALDPYAPRTVVDDLPDRFAGFTATGGWWTSGAQPSFKGLGSMLSQHEAVPYDSIANWEFDALAPGTYRFAATWVTSTGLATDAKATITGDGALEVQSLSLDQSSPPTKDLEFEGLNFQYIGDPVTTQDGRLKLSFNSDNTVGKVSADAVVLVPYTPGGPLTYFDFNDVGDGSQFQSTNGTTSASLAGATFTSEGQGYQFRPGDRALDTRTGHVSITDTWFLDRAAENDDLTVSFWQKLDGTQTSTSFLAEAPGYSSGISASVPEGSSIFFDSSGTDRLGAAYGVDLKQWNHFAFVKDGSEKSIYVNGSLLTSASGAPALPSDFSDLLIGGTSGSPSVDGFIDEFAVFGSALSPSKISILSMGARADSRSLLETVTAIDVESGSALISSQDFSVGVGTPTSLASRVVHLTNNTSGAFTISDVVATGPFALTTSAIGQTIASGESFSIVVSQSPEIGSHEGALQIFIGGNPDSDFDLALFSTVLPEHQNTQVLDNSDDRFQVVSGYWIEEPSLLGRGGDRLYSHSTWADGYVSWTFDTDLRRYALDTSYFGSFIDHSAATPVRVVDAVSGAVLLDTAVDQTSGPENEIGERFGWRHVGEFDAPASRLIRVELHNTVISGIPIADSMRLRPLSSLGAVNADSSQAIENGTDLLMGIGSLAELPTRTIEFTNSSTSPIQLSAIELQGSFEYLSNLPSNALLQPGEQIEITVKSEAVAGPHNGKLSVYSENRETPEFSVELFATVLAVGSLSTIVDDGDIRSMPVSGDWEHQTTHPSYGNAGGRAFSNPALSEGSVAYYFDTVPGEYLLSASFFGDPSYSSQTQIRVFDQASGTELASATLDQTAAPTPEPGEDLGWATVTEFQANGEMVRVELESDGVDYIVADSFRITSQLHHQDLLAYFDFNDASDTASSAAVVGGVTASLGGATYTDPGGGYQFKPGDRALDTTSGYATVTQTGFLDNAAADDAMTISMWQQLKGTTSAYAFFGSAAGYTDNIGVSGQFTPTANTIHFDHAGGATQRLSGYHNINLREWNHFAYVKDGPNKSIWINGELFVQSSSAAQLPIDFDSLFVGGNSFTIIDGFIDEFAVFDTALTPSVIGILAEGARADSPALLEAVAATDLEDSSPVVSHQNFSLGVGNVSAPRSRTIRLTNTTPGSLLLSDVQVTGPFTVTPSVTNNTVISSGQTFDVVITSDGALGTHEGLLEVFLDGKPTADFELSLFSTVVEDGVSEQVLDDSDDRFEIVAGVWVTSGIHARNGGRHYSARSWLDGHVQYVFDTEAGRQYDLDSSTVGNLTFSANVPIRVVDHVTGDLIQETTLDQSTMPEHELGEQFGWRNIIDFTATSRMVRVELHNTIPESAYMNADSMRLRALSGLSAAEQSSGATVDSSQPLFLGVGHLSNTPSKVVTLTNDTNGSMEVTGVTVPPGLTVTGSLPVTLVPGQSYDLSFAADSALGNVTGEVDVFVAGNPLPEVTFSAFATVLADGEFASVLDDGGDRFTVVSGDWYHHVNGSTGNEGDRRYSYPNAKAGYVSWNFDTKPGRYDIAASFLGHTSYPTDVPVKVYDVATNTLLLDTTLDQSSTPAPGPGELFGWREIGEFNATGEMVRVELESDGVDYIVADSFRITSQLPIGGDNSVSTAAHLDYPFQISDFPYSDLDDTTLQRVRVDSLPDRGTLSYLGYPVVEGEILKAGLIKHDVFIYRPEPGITSAESTSFLFSVGDSNAFSPVSSAMHVSVTVEPTIAELILTARADDDTVLPSSFGETEVGVGLENSFFLEVAYLDQRPLAERKGAFGVFTDIGFTGAAALQPVMRETQHIIIDEDIIQGSSGSVTIGIEGSSTTYVSTFNSLASGNFPQDLEAALQLFGYAATDFEVAKRDNLRQQNGDDLAFEVRFTGANMGNVDIPDLTFSPNFDVPVEFTLVEYSPLSEDGLSLNYEALQYGLDTRSRSVSNNQEVYDTINTGDFDPAIGFVDVSGTTTIGIYNIQEVDPTEDFTDPFDVFRLEVFLTEPLATPLVLNVSPSSEQDPVLLFERDEAVAPHQVRTDADASLTLVTAGTGSATSPLQMPPSDFTYTVGLPNPITLSEPTTVFDQEIPEPDSHDVVISLDDDGGPEINVVGTIVFSSDPGTGGPIEPNHPDQLNEAFTVYFADPGGTVIEQTGPSEFTATYSSPNYFNLDTFRVEINDDNPQTEVTITVDLQGENGEEVVESSGHATITLENEDATMELRASPQSVATSADSTIDVTGLIGRGGLYEIYSAEQFQVTFTDPSPRPRSACTRNLEAAFCDQYTLSGSDTDQFKVSSDVDSYITIEAFVDNDGDNFYEEMASQTVTVGDGGLGPMIPPVGPGNGGPDGDPDPPDCDDPAQNDACADPNDPPMFSLDGSDTDEGSNRFPTKLPDGGLPIDSRDHGDFTIDITPPSSGPVTPEMWLVITGPQDSSMTGLANPVLEERGTPLFYNPVPNSTNAFEDHSGKSDYRLYYVIYDGGAIASATQLGVSRSGTDYVTDTFTPPIDPAIQWAIEVVPIEDPYIEGDETIDADLHVAGLGMVDSKSVKIRDNENQASVDRDRRAACSCTCSVCGGNEVVVNLFEGTVDVPSNSENALLPRLFGNGSNGANQAVRFELAELNQKGPGGSNPQEITLHYVVSGYDVGAPSVSGQAELFYGGTSYDGGTFAGRLPIDVASFADGAVRLQMTAISEFGDTWSIQDSLYRINTETANPIVAPLFSEPHKLRLDVYRDTNTSQNRVAANNSLVQGAFLVRPNNSVSFFSAGEDGGEYNKPPEEQSELSEIMLEDDVIGYKLEHRDGSFDEFDTSGERISFTDASGNTTRFGVALTETTFTVGGNTVTASGGEVIIDPFGRKTTLMYGQNTALNTYQYVSRDYANRTTVFTLHPPASGERKLTVRHPDPDGAGMGAYALIEEYVFHVSSGGTRLLSLTTKRDVESGPATSDDLARKTVFNYRTLYGFYSVLESITRPDQSVWTLQQFGREAGLPDPSLYTTNNVVAWNSSPSTYSATDRELYQPFRKIWEPGENGPGDQVNPVLRFLNEAIAVDANGNEHTYELDRFGRVTTYIDPHGLSFESRRHINAEDAEDSGQQSGSDIPGGKSINEDYGEVIYTRTSHPELFTAPGRDYLDTIYPASIASHFNGVEGQSLPIEQSFDFDQNKYIRKATLPKLESTASSYEILFGDYVAGTTTGVTNELGHQTSFVVSPAGLIEAATQIIPDAAPEVLRIDESASARSDWHNSSAPSDVTFDGNLSPIDALTVINFLGRYADFGGDIPTDQVLPEENRFVDVNNDESVTAIDALRVINELARTSGGPALTFIPGLDESFTTQYRYVDEDGYRDLVASETYQTERGSYRIQYDYYLENEVPGAAYAGSIESITRLFTPSSILNENTVFTHVEAAVHFTYDANGYPSTISERIDSDDSTVERVHTFEYDNIGRLLQYSMPLDPLAPSESTRLDQIVRYEYNAFGELTKETIFNEYRTSPTTIVAEAHSTCYAYDDMGRLRYSVAPSPNRHGANGSAFSEACGTHHVGTASVADPMTTTPADEPPPEPAEPRETEAPIPTDWHGRPITYFEYDNNGNLIRTVRANALDETGSGNVNESSETTFEYDQLDQMIAAHEPSVPVRTNGTLVPPETGSETPTTYFVYDNVGRVAAVIDAEDNGTYYSYDEWNRPLAIMESDPDAPATNVDVKQFFEGQYSSLARFPITTFAYDAQTIAPGHGDSYGWKESVTDALNRTTTVGFNFRGDVRFVEQPKVAKPILDASGDPLPDEQDHPVTYFDYTVDGLLLRQFDAEGVGTEYAYNGLGLVSEVRHGFLDLFDNPDDSQNPQAASITRFGYDMLGRMTSHTDQRGQMYTYSYNNLDLLTKEAYPNVGVDRTPEMTFTYDSAGNVRQYSDRANSSLTLDTLYDYDGLFRRLSTTNPNDEVTTFHYDIASRMTSLEDAEGNTTKWEYDKLDRVSLEHQIRPDDEMDTRAFFYDLAGNLTSTIDRNGRGITYTYDNLYRVTSEQWYSSAGSPLGIQPEFEYAYDLLGNTTNVLSRHDDHGTTQTTEYVYVYDSLDRVDTITQQHGLLNASFHVDRGYDFVSNLTRSSSEFDDLNDTAGFEIDSVLDLQYDRLHRLKEMRQSSGATGNLESQNEKKIEYQYDLANRVSEFTRELISTSQQLHTGYVYDNANRLTNVVHSKSASGSITNNIVNYTYQFDAASRLQSMDINHNNDAYDVEVVYSGIPGTGYDDSGQLLGAVYRHRVTKEAQHTENYTYDDNGNRKVNQDVDPTSPDSHNRLNAATIDSELVSFQYDEEGNLTHRFIDENANASYDESVDTLLAEYEWDHRNRLRTLTEYTSDEAANTSTVTTIDHHYDAFNQWLGSDVNHVTTPSGGGTPSTQRYRKYFLYDRGQIAYEFVGTTSAGQPTVSQSDLKRRNLWALAVDQLLAFDEIIPTGDTDDVTYWTLTDHQGSVRDIVDDSGTVVRNHLYDSFGNILDSAGTGADTIFGYTGRPMDEETGLQNNLHRWYDSSTGRWISQDPIGFAAGDTNLYRYVGNGPGNAIDPTGLVEEFPEEDQPEREKGHKKKKGTSGNPEKHSAAERARRLQQQNAARRAAREAKNDIVNDAFRYIDIAIEELEDCRKTSRRKMLRGGSGVDIYRQEMEEYTEAIERLKEIEIDVEDGRIVDIKNIDDLPKPAFTRLTKSGRWVIKVGGKVFIPLGAWAIASSANTGYAGGGLYKDGGVIGAMVETGRDYCMHEDVNAGVSGLARWVFGFLGAGRKGVHTQRIEDLAKPVSRFENR